MNEVSFVVNDADGGLRERLDEEINAFNAAVTGHHDGRLLCITVRGKSGDLRAGLYGWTWGGCGYIDLLWVRDDQRGRGLGTRLLTTAEREIQRRDCDRVALSTPLLPSTRFLRPFRLSRMRSHARLPPRVRPHPPAEAAWCRRQVNPRPTRIRSANLPRPPGAESQSCCSAPLGPGSRTESDLRFLVSGPGFEPGKLSSAIYRACPVLS
jgi:GNAT superfamily N-acetyltransferase